MNVDAVLPNPVFLVGAERSGSTMLRLMLNDHPQVCWLNEFEYAVDKVSDQGSWPKLAAYRDWLSTHRIFTSTGFSMDPELDYPHLVNSFLLQKQKMENKPLVGATVHRNFDRLLKVWPDAKFIHLVRDPRDVARSVLQLGWVGHIYYGADRWLEAESIWDQLKQRLPPERFVELRFEDLLQSPTATLNPLWDLLGVSADVYEMKYWESTTYSPPDGALAYQWKRKLSEYDVRLLESKVHSQLQAKGYERSDYPELRPSAWERQRLKLANRTLRVQKRVKRYGVTMWMASVLHKRLPSCELKRKIRLKLNEIERLQLK